MDYNLTVRSWNSREFAEALGVSVSHVNNMCARYEADGRTYRLPPGFTAYKNAAGGWVITGDERDLHPPVMFYAVQETRGCDHSIKLGITTLENTEKRFRSIRNGNWRNPQAVAFMVANRKIERDLHQRFKHLKLGGEWLRPAPDLIAYLNEIRRDFPDIQPTTEPRLPHDLP